jgi:hypothetical protein
MDDPILNQKVEALLDNMTEGARHIGLYTQHAATMPAAETPFSDHLDRHLRDDDSAQVAVTMVFMIGDRAYEDEIQNPEAAKFKREFDDMRPDTMEMFESIKEDLKKEFGTDPDSTD